MCRWKGNGPATRRAMQRFKWRGQARRFYVDRPTSCQQLASVMCRCLKICWSRAGWPNSVLDYKNQGVMKARRLHCDKLQAHTCDTATTWQSRVLRSTCNQQGAYDSSEGAEQTTNQPTDQPTDRPTNQPTNQPANQTTNQSINQPANQPNQETGRPTNQPTN